MKTNKTTMITKKRILEVVKETAAESGMTLDRAGKFKMFCNVCDNLLAVGTITAAAHKRYTEVF